MIDNILRNLQYSVRTLSRTPSFTITVILTLALGIGSTAAVFSVVNSVLLKPLPYPDAEELVAIWHVAPGAPGITDASGGLRTSPSMYVTYSEESSAFQNVGLWYEGSATVTGMAEPEQVGIAAVSSGVLETLRVQPLLGRWFNNEEQTPGGPNRVILSYDYWQMRFGGDPGVIGSNITANALSAEVVGVMPPGFRIVDSNPELIFPARIDSNGLDGPPFCCRAIARLKTGLTLAEGNADIARMLPIWVERFSPGDRGRAVFLDTWKIAPALKSLKQEVIGGVGDVLWIVLGTVGIVLLIACANVTNLLLVRAEGRRREIAVRTALGANVRRVAHVLLAESILLGLLGGVVGVVIAYGVLNLLVALGPSGLPRLYEISLDVSAVILIFGISLVSGVVLGILPALKFSGPGVVAGLHSGSRSVTGNRRQYRTQNALVIVQVALALVLLVSSGLMIRSFQSLLTVDPGFTDPNELQVMRLSIPASVEPDPDRVLRMQNDIVNALEAMPGIESAAFISAMPLENRDADWDVLRVEGAPALQGQDTMPIRRFKYLSPGLLQTAGTRLIAGRDITWEEVYDDRRVALVSENLALELFGSAEAAIGRRVGPGRADSWREIIGVVQDVRDNALDEPAPAIVYWPTLMTDFYDFQPRTLRRSVTFVIRSPLAGTQTLITQMQQAVWSVNPDLPLALVRTMRDVYDQSLARTSFTLVMLGIAGGVALLLGVIGLYGVLSYVVSQRRRDIAIRLALGAQQRDVTRGLVRYGIALTIVGVALGLGAASALTRLMTSLLHGVHPVDFISYAIVAVLLMIVSALASYLPARRASAVDPAEVLTNE